MRRIIAWLLSLFAVSSSAPWSAGAWIPQWDAEAGLREAKSLAKQLDTAVAFAAYFREDGTIYLPMETENLLIQLQKQFAGSDTRVYLSVVNDVVGTDGKTVNKSRELLEQLLADEASEQKHLADLLELVDVYRLDGLEIDYENIKDNEALWEKYAAFLEHLRDALSGYDTAIRADLEWKAASYVSLPEGITYSVMCYNLYGYHSGPGPKADSLFLSRVAKLYADRADEVSMALACGGFLWEDGKVIRAVTQQEAREAAKAAGAKCVRDGAGGALHAEWKADGRKYALWYADGVTLHAWQQQMLSEGFTHFDLYRLGGNDISDLRREFFAG